MQKKVPTWSLCVQDELCRPPYLWVHRMQLRYLHRIQPKSVQVCKVQFAHFVGHVCIH